MKKTLLELIEEEVAPSQRATPLVRPQAEVMRIVETPITRIVETPITPPARPVPGPRARSAPAEVVSIVETPEPKAEPRELPIIELKLDERKVPDFHYRVVKQVHYDERGLIRHITETIQVEDDSKLNETSLARGRYSVLKTVHRDSNGFITEIIETIKDE